jgi:coenzyme F420-reducing hydrogenase beta subunit
MKYNSYTGENVLESVVSNNLCIGCGMCAGICPFNEFGEYVSRKQGGRCPDTCNVCLKVCPFSAQPENEDTLGTKLFANVPGIKHTPETGYYLENFVGYSTVHDHRANGASGGLATWILETLLNENLVDQVACVSPTKVTEKLFKFAICSSPEDIRKCSRSCYYPVEISEMIQHILSNEGRYAIVGLPCVCKAIRLAMQLNPKLQDRVKFVLGLTCGQTKSKFFAEYICALGGGDPKYLEQFTFRVKEPRRPASDFGMKFICQTGKNPPREGVVFWSEGIDQIWNHRYFTPNACNFCDDVFAELADICFMDAWLPEYFPNWRGHSIVLVRGNALVEVLEESINNGSLSAKKLNIREVVKSQLGVLHSKRGDISRRIRLSEKDGQITPKKRLSLCDVKLSPGRKHLIRAQYLISRKSREEWFVAKRDLPGFLTKMKPYIIRLRIALFLEKLGRAPRGIMRRLRRFLI